MFWLIFSYSPSHLIRIHFDLQGLVDVVEFKSAQEVPGVQLGNKDADHKKE